MALHGAPRVKGATVLGLFPKSFQYGTVSVWLGTSGKCGESSRASFFAMWVCAGTSRVHLVVSACQYGGKASDGVAQWAMTGRGS